MSHFLDRLSYFSNPRENFSDGFGVTNGEDRTCDDCARRYTDLPILVMLRTVQKGERAIPTCPSADYRAFVPCVGGFPVGRKGSAKISELAAPARKLSMRPALTICGLPQR
jgi:hypothetical protein